MYIYIYIYIYPYIYTYLYISIAFVHHPFFMLRTLLHVYTTYPWFRTNPKVEVAHGCLEGREGTMCHVEYSRYMQTVTIFTTNPHGFLKLFHLKLSYFNSVLCWHEFWWEILQPRRVAGGIEMEFRCLILSWASKQQLQKKGRWMVSFNHDVFLIFHPPFFYHFNTDIFTYIRTSGSGLLRPLTCGHRICSSSSSIWQPVHKGCGL